MLWRRPGQPDGRSHGKKDSANQLSVQVAESSRTSETLQTRRGEDAGYDGTSSHLHCASSSPRRQPVEELHAARTPAHRAVGTRKRGLLRDTMLWRGLSHSDRWLETWKDHWWRSLKTWAPLSRGSKVKGMVQAAFASHREKQRRHPFLFPWEALKISLANLINSKKPLKTLRDQYTLMNDKCVWNPGLPSSAFRSQQECRLFLKPSQAQVCSVPPVGARRSPLTRLHPSSTTQGGAACSSPWLRLEISKGLSIVQHSTCLRSHRSSESKKGGGRNKGGQKWGRGEKGAGRKEREAKAQRKGGKGGEKDRRKPMTATHTVRKGKGAGRSHGRRAIQTEAQLYATAAVTRDLSWKWEHRLTRKRSVL